jgi:hypothetical protein
MKNRKIWYGLAALAAAWCFDFLFWGKTAGISFLIWIVVLLGLGYVLAWRESKKPSVWSVLLTVLIIGFAVLAAWRSEGLTRFTSIVMALTGSLLLIATFLNGHWTAFRLLDFISELGKTLWAGLSRGFGLFVHASSGNQPPELPEQKTGKHRIGSVLLGLVIALPILLILGLLLVSADPIYGDMVKRLFSIDKLPEYLFRFFYIVVGAYVLVGLFLHAVLPNQPAERPDTQKPVVSAFLGPIEGNIVMGAVNLLFLSFVIVQIRYLFGGSANISETGYTYSEYARKGFGELVGVAVLSLLLYLVFNSITKRESKAARTLFSALSVLLIANVLVILASSLMRLLMYEDAYGFSELRTYTHIFIFWLAGLLVASIVLELLHKRGSFGLALMIFMIGYSATLGLVNVDGFITQKNISRAETGYELDVDYLSTLTSDAVPVMVNTYLDETQSKSVRQALGAELACRSYTLSHKAAAPWQSLRFGEAQAEKMLLDHQTSWSQYKVISDSNGLRVTAGSSTYNCYAYSWDD